METAESHNLKLTGKIDVDKIPSRARPLTIDKSHDWDGLFKATRNRVRYDRDEDWLELVRQHACMNCQAPGPNDPHHVFGSHGPLKTSDYAVIPLCRGCHVLVEQSRSAQLDCIGQLIIFLVSVLREIHQKEKNENDSAYSIE